MGKKNNENLICLMFSVLLFSGNVFSQTANSFDINRYSTFGAGFFETYYVQNTRFLREALSAELIAEDTAILITKTDAGYLALIRDQMAFHHIAQGTVNSKDWMATF